MRFESTRKTFTRGYKSTLKAIDWLVIGDPEKQPGHLARAAIAEHDTSNRTGDVRLGPFKGVEHGRKPHYGRRYDFTLPVWYDRYPYTLFLEDRVPLKPAHQPAGEFRDYVTTAMEGQVTWALLGKYTLDITLTRRADDEWRQAPPAAFYDRMIEFYRRMHPSVVSCVVLRPDGPYPSS